MVLEEILRRATTGGVGWFFQREAHAALVYRFALRLTGDRHLAEDLTQETFLRAWRARRRLRDPDAAGPWPATFAKAKPADPAAPEEVKLLEVYRFRHIDIRPLLQIASQILPDCQISSATTNSLSVYATREDHDRIAELIETLDVAPEPSQIEVFRLVESRAADLVEALVLRLDESSSHDVDESATYQIRVIWLVSGLGEGAAPADDLQGVIEELAKVGAVGLQQVCQVVVNTTADGDFEVQCSPQLNQEPVSSGMRQLVNIETTIRLPDGHFAVLGATPIEQLTSVFVVQVVPSEK